MKKFFILLSFVAFFLTTCTKIQGPVPDSTSSVSACDTGYWYDGHIETIITTKCASLSGCHGASPGGVDFTTYAGVKYDVDNGTFNDRVFVVKDMPQAPGSPLTTAELDRISCWLSKGAPQTGTNTGGGGTSGCTTTISYSATIAPIISTNCSTSSGCHGAGSVNGDYTVYSGLFAKVTNNSLNNRVVVVKDMATFPILSTPLSSADISKIDCWIKQGGLNN